MEKVVVIGAGLAGCEAAWQLANRGVQVDLYEMRPTKMSPAHHTDLFGELVCSNSLRAAGIENAVGLMKEEMRRMESLIMQAADATAEPAGGALAVDRIEFSRYITEKIRSHENIRVIEQEVTKLDFDAITIVASGPLTGGELAEEIGRLAGEEYCYFYDAAAPIVTGESLDWDKVYRASRYGKGDADYVNCPFNEEEYKAFWEALTTAEETPTKEFEKQIFFEGCMPIEVMARRGIDTMRFGPMKPVGLEHPVTGAKPYAVVQLRLVVHAASLYNFVGFQTLLKWP